MKRVSTAELRELEVINLCGGEKLGYPCDFEVDLDNARLISIIVSGSGGIPFFTKKEEYVIPWCNIECIGEDAILVKLTKNDLNACTRQHFYGKKKK